MKVRDVIHVIEDNGWKQKQVGLKMKSTGTNCIAV
jgi:predicted RNA binding protein YcfA (HicA-like mRNA interferase family)